MLGPLAKGLEWAKPNNTPKASPSKPSGLTPRQLNFVTWHYIYVVGMTILCSIFLYPRGGLAYIDALFFAAGTATQSGLNTVNVNDLNSFQQIVIIIVESITSIVFVNICVVFVRLYWFERRFKNLVREARSLRRSRSRSRTIANLPAGLDQEAGGVGGREIIVLRGPDGHVKGRRLESGQGDGIGLQSGQDATAMYGGSSRATTGAVTSENVELSDGYDGERPPGFHLDDTQAQSPAFRRDIKFADEIKPPQRYADDTSRAPERWPNEQRVPFIENQRNLGDHGALRIPGPRDFDRGDIPVHVDTHEAEPGVESRIRKREDTGRPTELSWDDDPRRSHATSEEQEHSRGRVRDVLADSRLNGSNKASSTEPPADLRQRRRSRTFTGLLPSRSREVSQDRDLMPYLSYAATIGRNSTFIDLNEAQREELGGIEYRSLKTLAIILIIYYVGYIFLGIIILLPWIVLNRGYRSVLDADGQSGVMWAFFTPPSAINNVGYTVTPDSMVSFQTATLPLLVSGFLIIVGNTGFPCMLRFVIWVTSKCVTHGSGLWEELRFLLDHPRRCFTLLFPSKPTWWLFAVLIILNSIDLILFIVLNLDNPTLASLSPGYRFLDGLFQAVSTRTAGFACVNLAALHPAIQVSYLIMMYISALPIAISIRRTNVYEEKSLGIYADDGEGGEDEPSYIGAHLRRQLSFDLWYIFLGLFLVSVVEGKRLQRVDDSAFSLFAILFEIISAYGTVGLSLGYPNIDASLSAEFRTLSKLIIIAMMIRGRHRGLPYALDKAILLPNEALHKKEPGGSERRAQRRRSSVIDREKAGVLTQAADTSTSDRGEGSDTSPAPKARGLALKKVVSGALSAGPVRRA